MATVTALGTQGVGHYETRTTVAYATDLDPSSIDRRQIAAHVGRLVYGRDYEGGPGTNPSVDFVVDKGDDRGVLATGEGQLRLFDSREEGLSEAASPRAVEALGAVLTALEQGNLDNLSAAIQQ